MTAPPAPLSPRAAVFATLAATLRALPGRIAKSLALHAALWGAVLCALALVAYRLSPGGEGWCGTLVLVAGAALVPVATLVGLVCGAVFGVTSPLLRAARDVQAALRAVLAPVLSNATASVFGGRASMSVEEFDRALDERIAETLDAPAAAGGGGRVLLRHGASLARARISRELARRAQRAGGRVEPGMAAAVAGDAILDAAAGALTMRVRLVQWVAAGVAALLGLALASIVLRAASA
ncbi:MAG TPA: hypothetical protein VMR23_15875 [Candidatus Limnocylindria bacterium]|nr:hypothetical protein [Candidatus Limnocylindria bacterium]